MIGEIEQIHTTLETVCQATLSIVKATDLNKVLQQITDSTRETISAEFAAMGIYAEDGTLQYFVVSGHQQSSPPSPIPTTSDILNTIIKNNDGIRIIHTPTNKLNSLPATSNLPENFIGMPINVGNGIDGAIYLINKQHELAFTKFDEDITSILAAHAAVAIRKALLLKNERIHQEELHKRNQQLAALNHAVMAIAGELSLNSVLQQIVDSARELANSEYAALGVPNQEGFLDEFIFSGMNHKQAEEVSNLPKGLGLLGAIYQERSPIRIPKISADMRSRGFPKGHPPMDSFLGVPVIAGGEILGNLYLTNKIDADEFTQEDEELVQLLAANAAIAIQNARLYEQVGRLAIIEERTRIGMDLHDGIIQSIYAVGLTLESSRFAMKEDIGEADQLLENAIDALNGTIRDIRNFILDLRPHRFRGNLRQGLARLIREFQANAMIIVTLTAPEGSFSNLPTPIARAVFLTSQEALANVARHARATEVQFDVVRTSTYLSITIADNGQGFDLETKKNRLGHGLSNMQARMEELGGRFLITSPVNQGTSITLEMPLTKK
ncbi:MAG: GAF domain-containing sensor histidine kinase [Chloroflexi bacterium]|nr:GAF domain-containing sensor histidine kinase [Chloroflexota bacterium]